MCLLGWGQGGINLLPSVSRMECVGCTGSGVDEGGSFHEVLFLALGSRASEGHAETRHP